MWCGMRLPVDCPPERLEVYMELPELEKALLTYCKKANAAEQAAIDAVEQYEILEDAKKAYFAKLVDDAKGKSGMEKERVAIQDARWIEWMAGYGHARKKAAQAKVDRSTAVRNWETIRSLIASKRVERMTGT